MTDPTDAPKIDTQAPERLRAFARETKTTLNGVSDQIADDIIALLAERDLADARAAAAWQGGIDALLDRVGDLPISEIAADEVIYAAKQLTPPADASTALDRLIAERVREATAELRGLLWLACHEFNAIRARSGAPLDQYGMTTVSEEWWDQMTQAFKEAIGPDANKPWPSEEAKAVTAKIAARASKEDR